MLFDADFQVFYLTLFLFFVQSFGTKISFINLPTTIQIPENSTKGDVVISVNASHVNNDPMSFSLTSMDPANGPFVVDLATGVMTLTDPNVLDFESNTTTGWNVTVSITDGSEVAETVIAVEVEDVDEAPEFTNLPDTVELYENATGVSIIYLVESTDPEGGNVTYSCSVKPNDGNFKGSCSGGENTIRHIARPKLSSYWKPQYNFTVNATSGSTSTSFLLIDIINAINERPLHLNLPKYTNVKETTNGGTVVFKIYMADPEYDPLNITIDYDPVTAKDLLDVIVENYTIIVKLKQSLDYESDPRQIKLTVTGCEIGTDPVLCSKTETLTINLVDTPDVPVFSYYPNPVLYPENTGNETHPVALDFKWNITGVTKCCMKFYFINSNKHKPFSIDPITGRVLSKWTADYEAWRWQTLIPKFVDSKGVRYWGKLVINVADRNEYTPQFEKLTYESEIKEDVKPDTWLFRMIVKDADYGPIYGKMEYTLLSPGDKYFRIFKTAHGGYPRLIVTNPIDRESLKSDTLSFKLRATDGGGLHNETTVIFKVIDVNDNDPVFEEEQYTFMVSTDVEKGAEIGKVKATDPDSEELIQYIMNKTSSLTNAFISKLDGTLIADGTYEVGQTYEYFVNARDKAWHMSKEARITVIPYDPEPVLTEWVLDTEEVTEEQIEQFETNVEALCDSECDVEVVDTHKEEDSGHVVLQVMIVKDVEDPTSIMTKEEQMDMISNDDGTLTEEAKRVAPFAGEILEVAEAIEEPKKNWWLETPEGLAMTAILSLAGFSALTTALAVCLDYVWWSHRPESRYIRRKSLYRPPSRQVTPRQKSTPINMMPNLPGSA